MVRSSYKYAKNENGTISIRTTIPAELADTAISLQNLGYSAHDWIRIGILHMREREGLVKL